MEQGIERIKRLSADLADNLEHAGFDEIEAYMLARVPVFAELMNHGQKELSADQREKLTDLFHMDRRIVSRMKEIYVELGIEIQRMNSVKKSKSVYDKDNYNDDHSYFFDTKR